MIQVASTTHATPILPLLWKNLTPLVRSPLHFLTSRTTRLLFTVYFGTYTTANTLDSIYEHLNSKPYTFLSHTTVKILGVSTVSTALTVYKDSRLTQMFGASTKPQPVPLPSYALFTARDVLTIYGCFVLPSLLAQRLDDVPSSFKQRLLLDTPESRARVSQLILPMMIQFISTPIHLYALDLYNRQQGGLKVWDRLARVNRDLPAAVPTRMMRILPAFGVGGVLNIEVRAAMLRRFGFGTGKVPAG